MDYTIKSLVKASEILELLAEKPLTAKKIVELLDMNKSTLHRFLYTLEIQNYIERNHNNEYQLSQKIIRLGLMAQNNLELSQVGKPFLIQMAERFGESCLLGSLDHDKVFYMDKVESANTVRIVLDAGQSAPLYTVASGKVFLAAMSQQHLRRYLETNELKSMTKNTITDKSQLLDEIKKIREKGYAIDNEELEAGLRGIAVPVRNYTGNTIAALCVAGVSMRFSQEKAELISEDLKQIGNEFSKQLGFKPG
ncbi:IclR family transcriptional regulator [Scopulibacillus darangshiensis]|uniref:IclR family transcriptional regulator n=1 Tax=Scopulibacillus darangshiensis TaxID=442528 RepID=A0A4R2NHB9_9BACL|nr:IclR family transcriptional regulator [Scopulibacillus darangshiensis]TCP20700.1 IclR family transcriptional regulator [Scopulibacillus darangshiensis]